MKLTKAVVIFLILALTMCACSKEHQFTFDGNDNTGQAQADDRAKTDAIDQAGVYIRCFGRDAGSAGIAALYIVLLIAGSFAVLLLKGRTAEGVGLIVLAIFALVCCFGIFGWSVGSVMLAILAVGWAGIPGIVGALDLSAGETLIDDIVIWGILSVVASGAVLILTLIFG